MGYSTKQEVIQALANALSQGNPTTPGTLTPITSVGNMVADVVTDDQIFQYIRWADENIDAWVSSIYQTPLVRINEGSYDLGADVTAGDTQLIMLDGTRFTEGDVILIRDSSAAAFQQLTINTIPNENTITLTAPVILSYSALTTKIERIRYPDPVPKMSARLAAAYLYDKHFAAQVDGNESEYGKYLRRLAYQDVNSILTGMTRLKIPDAGMFVGRRYYNHALDDVTSTKAKPGNEFLKI